MLNGEQVLYLQQLRVDRAIRVGILEKFEATKLEELEPLAMAPERHEMLLVECKGCKEFGPDEDCSCKGTGNEPTHCGVEGCYQCEIWPLH